VNPVSLRKAPAKVAIAAEESEAPPLTASEVIWEKALGTGSAGMKTGLRCFGSW